LRLIFVNRFYHPDLSATAQMLTDLATGLAADFDVLVVTSRGLYNDPCVRLDRRQTLAGVAVHRLSTTRLGRANLWRRAADYLSFYVLLLFFLVRRVNRKDTVVFMTDPPLAGLVNTALVRLKGGRVVNWLQDLFPEVAIELGVFPTARPLSAPLIGWRNRALKAARVNVVVSDSMQSRLARQGVTNTRCIPNWADGESIVPLEHRDNELRDQWNLQGRFLVGYSGNFGRAHTFREMLDAMMSLQNTPDIHFVMIGDGARLAEVRAESDRLQLHNVSFKPYQSRDRLQQSLGAIDLHLVTLREKMEGLLMPSKVYGILAAGRPLAYVGDRNGEVAGIVTSNEIGFVVGLGDGTGLAEQILKLSREPGQLRFWSDNARELFDRKFSKTAALTRWKQLLREDATKVRNPS
jgi:glycosyltransferase involved in cell wall biosynthesis